MKLVLYALIYSLCRSNKDAIESCWGDNCWESYLQVSFILVHGTFGRWIKYLPAFTGWLFNTLWSNISNCLYGLESKANLCMFLMLYQERSNESFVSDLCIFLLSTLSIANTLVFFKVKFCHFVLKVFERADLCYFS